MESTEKWELAEIIKDIYRKTLDNIDSKKEELSYQRDILKLQEKYNKPTFDIKDLIKALEVEIDMLNTTIDLIKKELDNRHLDIPELSDYIEEMS